MAALGCLYNFDFPSNIYIPPICILGSQTIITITVNIKLVVKTEGGDALTLEAMETVVLILVMAIVVLFAIKKD